VLDAERLPHARHGRRPVGAQLPPPLAHVEHVVRADKPAYRVATVELGLDVPHEFDAVRNEVGHQPVDHGALHDHAHQTGLVQIALAELRALQVLVHVGLTSSPDGPRIDLRTKCRVRESKLGIDVSHLLASERICRG
jgi:hypothetical protein